MKHTAQQMAVNFGHTNIDSSATLRSMPNPAVTADGHDELMCLQVSGTGTDAFFAWVSEYGDQIGDRFYEIDARELWWEPTTPPGYTAEELDRDNPHTQWLKERNENIK